MRVIDPAWVGAKLRQLMDFAEVRGDFWGRTPGSEKSENQPSTVAYIAKLILHRFAMLGILDDSGFAVQNLGYFSDEAAEPKTESKPMFIKGKVCATCKAPAVIKKDGCDWCSACGEVGSCG